MISPLTHIALRRSIVTPSCSACSIVSRGYAAKAPAKGGKGKEAAAAPAPATPAASSSSSSSAAPPGTVLAGLSILKDTPDPVALEDSAYPPWLFKLLDDPSIASASSLASETAGMSKGEARAATKRNAKILRATQLAAAKAAAKNKDATTADGQVPIETLSGEAMLEAEAQALAASKDAAEKEKKLALRKANKEKIKARNFVSAS